MKNSTEVMGSGTFFILVGAPLYTLVLLSFIFFPPPASFWGDNYAGLLAGIIMWLIELLLIPIFIITLANHQRNKELQAKKLAAKKSED